MVKVKIRTPYDKLFDEMHETCVKNEHLITKLQNLRRDKNNVDMSLGVERSVSEGLRRKNETLRKAVDQAHDGRTSAETREDKLTLALDAARAENKALAEKHDETVSRLRSVSTLSNERWQRCRHAENEAQALQAENKALQDKCGDLEAGYAQLAKELRSSRTLAQNYKYGNNVEKADVVRLEDENKALANSLNYQDRLLQEANKERDASRTQAQNLTTQLQDAHLESFAARNEKSERLAKLRDDLRDLLDVL